MFLRQNKQSGFSLLEMMIVVAIISLLITLAVPNYHRYTQRAKFTEVIQAVIPYKIGVTLCAYQHGDLSMCDTPGQNNIPNATENNETGYVKTVTVNPQGIIIATSKNIKLDKKTAFTYTLKPTLQSNGACQWTIDETAPNSCKRYHLC